MQFDEAVRILEADHAFIAPVAAGARAVAVTIGAQEIHLHADPQGEGFCLEARLGSLEGLPNEILLAMMAGNRWPQESLAGVLCMDACGAALLVHRVEGAGLAVLHFHSLLQRFAAHAGLWREHLASVPCAQGGGHTLEALA
jgi:hypothetical protein